MSIHNTATILMCSGQSFDLACVRSSREMLTEQVCKSKALHVRTTGPSASKPSQVLVPSCISVVSPSAGCRLLSCTAVVSGPLTASKSALGRLLGRGLEAGSEARGGGQATCLSSALRHVFKPFITASCGHACLVSDESGSMLGVGAKQSA